MNIKSMNNNEFLLENSMKENSDPVDTDDRLLYLFETNLDVVDPNLNRACLHVDDKELNSTLYKTFFLVLLRFHCQSSAKVRCYAIKFFIISLN